MEFFLEKQEITNSKSNEIRRIMNQNNLTINNQLSKAN